MWSFHILFVKNFSFVFLIAQNFILSTCPGSGTGLEMMRNRISKINNQDCWKEAKLKLNRSRWWLEFSCFFVLFLMFSRKKWNFNPFFSPTKNDFIHILSFIDIHSFLWHESEMKNGNYQPTTAKNIHNIAPQYPQSTAANSKAWHWHWQQHSGKTEHKKVFRVVVCMLSADIS